MKFKKYITYLPIGVFIIVVLGIILMNYTPNINSIILSGGKIKNNIQKQISNPIIPEIKSWELILIENIISKRYLYTLSKIIEEKLSQLSNASIWIESNYTTYSNIMRVGNNFIFTLHNKQITIPTSSYFFDTWNKKSKKSISWEWTIPTWIIDQNPKKLIALTFDDGPSPKYTHILLDILKKENIHATFYVLGSRVIQYPDVLKRTYTEWHEIGNHSYSHALFTKLSDRDMQEELYKTDQIIYTTIGIYPKTFRPPYGWVNPIILRNAGMPAILWSIDPHDWKTHSIKRNINSIANAKDWDILIMHDIHEASVASIPTIIKKLKDQGFTFVTITELLSLSDTNMQIWKTCTKKGSCK